MGELKTKQKELGKERKKTKQRIGPIFMFLMNTPLRLFPTFFFFFKQKQTLVKFQIFSEFEHVPRKKRERRKRKASRERHGHTERETGGTYIFVYLFLFS